MARCSTHTAGAGDYPFFLSPAGLHRVKAPVSVLRFIELVYIPRIQYPCVCVCHASTHSLCLSQWGVKRDTGRGSVSRNWLFSLCLLPACYEAIDSLLMIYCAHIYFLYIPWRFTVKQLVWLNRGPWQMDLFYSGGKQKNILRFMHKGDLDQQAQRYPSFKYKLQILK